MRTVLHFKTRYLNPSETFIDRLVRNHVRYTPVIATAEKRHYTEGLNVMERPKKGLRGLANQLALSLNASPPFLYRLVREHRPDVLHGHFGPDGFRLLRVARRANLPLVVSFHGYDVMRLPGEWGWKRRYRKLAQTGACFTVASRDQRGDLVGLDFPEERVEVVKMGLDLERIRFEHRSQAGPRLMAVGRMVEKKGFEYALKAVSELKKRGISVHLDLYGDGPLREKLSHFKGALDLNGCVTIHGLTSNEHVIDALYRHDILLVPSVLAQDKDKEGIPQTIAEGMATGIPVVGTDHAGIPELVRHEQTGLLVPERAPAALADAIHTYLTSPGLVSKVSERGRRAVEENHSVRGLVEKMEAIYDRVVERHRAVNP